MEPIAIHPDDTIECTKCLKHLPFSSFHKTKHCTYLKRCKACNMKCKESREITRRNNSMTFVQKRIIILRESKEEEYDMKELAEKLDEEIQEKDEG